MIGRARVRLNLDRACGIPIKTCYHPHYAPVWTLLSTKIIPTMVDRHIQRQQQPDHPYLSTANTRLLKSQVRCTLVDQLKQVCPRCRDRDRACLCLPGLVPPLNQPGTRTFILLQLMTFLSPVVLPFLGCTIIILVDLHLRDIPVVKASQDPWSPSPPLRLG